jgi:hypothetical protein
VCCLCLVQSNLITLVQEQSHIEQDTVAFVRRSSRSLSFFKQFKTAQVFHGLV